MERVAVNRFISAGASGLPLLTGSQEPMDRAEAVVLTAIIHEESAVTMDDYNALLDDLAEKVAEAEANERSVQSAQVDLQHKQDEAMAEVERLKLVERDRLNDEAVMRALDAQRQKQLESQERLLAEKLKADQAAILAEEEAMGSDGGDEGLGVITNNQASGGSSGGTTGGGGSGGRPADGYGVVYGSGEDWVCPVQGAEIYYEDSWGAPRSGGRFHQGVDLIAAAGTPVVAVVDGYAVPHINTLGGTTIALHGVDGHRYYYAHLARWMNLWEVKKGTEIGLVGQTGNAIYSTAHLHFEIHPGEGPAVNPYPTVKANCDPSVPDILPPSTPGPPLPGATTPDPATPTPSTTPSTAPTTTPTTEPAAPPPPADPRPLPRSNPIQRASCRSPVNG